MSVITDGLVQRRMRNAKIQTLRRLRDANIKSQLLLNLTQLRLYKKKQYVRCMANEIVEVTLEQFHIGDMSLKCRQKILPTKKMRKISVVQNT